MVVVGVCARGPRATCTSGVSAATSASRLHSRAGPHAMLPHRPKSVQLRERASQVGVLSRTGPILHGCTEHERLHMDDMSQELHMPASLLADLLGVWEGSCIQKAAFDSGGSLVCINVSGADQHVRAAGSMGPCAQPTHVDLNARL